MELLSVLETERLKKTVAILIAMYQMHVHLRNVLENLVSSIRF